MTVPSNSAARTLGKLSDWSLSNLSMQKILYVAHLYHMGRTGGSPLVKGSFEAWDLGPVHPTVYHRAKVFGSGEVKDVFRDFPLAREDCPEYASIAAAYDMLKDRTPADLVKLTHHPDGAWWRCYVPGARGIVIPNEAIMDEYRARSGE